MCCRMTHDGMTQHWMTHDGMTDDGMTQHWMTYDGMTQHRMVRRSSRNRRYRQQEKRCDQDDTHLSPSFILSIKRVRHDEYEPRLNWGSLSFPKRRTAKHHCLITRLEVVDVGGEPTMVTTRGLRDRDTASCHRRPFKPEIPHVRFLRRYRRASEAALDSARGRLLGGRVYLLPSSRGMLTQAGFHHSVA